MISERIANMSDKELERFVSGGNDQTSKNINTTKGQLFAFRNKSYMDYKSIRLAVYFLHLRSHYIYHLNFAIVLYNIITVPT